MVKVLVPTVRARPECPLSSHVFIGATKKAKISSALRTYNMVAPARLGDGDAARRTRLCNTIYNFLSGILLGFTGGAPPSLPHFARDIRRVPIAVHFAKRVSAGACHNVRCRRLGGN